MVIDYSVVPEPVSFQVADIVDSSHPIIEPCPWKPNHGNLSSGDSRPSNVNDSSEDAGSTTSQPTLRLSPEVEFSSSVFQPPKKKTSSPSSRQTTTKDNISRTEVTKIKRTGSLDTTKPKSRAGDVYEFKSGDEDEEEEEETQVNRSDTSSGDERELNTKDTKDLMNMSPRVKLQDIALSKSKPSETTKISEKKDERRRDRKEHIILTIRKDTKREGRPKGEPSKTGVSSSSSKHSASPKVFNTRSKSKSSQFKRSVSISSKSSKDRRESKKSKHKNKSSISAREISELQRDSYIEFTDGRPKRNLKPSLRKVESDMYVINSSEAYGSTSRDSSRDKHSSRDKEKGSRSGAVKTGSPRRDSGSRSGSSRETSRERHDSKDRRLRVKIPFRSSRKTMPKSGSRFGSPQRESKPRSGSRSGSSRETSKGRHDSKDKYKLKVTLKSGSRDMKPGRTEVPSPKPVEKPEVPVIDKRHPIKRFHREYQKQMAELSEEEDNKGEYNQLYTFFT